MQANETQHVNKVLELLDVFFFFESMVAGSHYRLNTFWNKLLNALR